MDKFRKQLFIYARCRPTENSEHDGSKLLIAHKNALHIYDPLSGKPLTTLPNPPGSKDLWLEKVEWSPRGTYIFCS